MSQAPVSICVVCEGQGSAYRSSTYELLSQARRLAAGGNATVVALALGADASHAEALRGLAHRVVAAEGRNLTPYMADPWVGALAGLLQKEQPQLVLFGEGARAREVIPLLGARLAAMTFTNAVGLERDGASAAVTRPAFGGKAYATYRCSGRLVLAAFRPNSFDASAPAVADTAVETVEVVMEPSRVEMLEHKPRETKRVDLAEAQRVVAGGRGLKSPENLKLLEDLADALGGAVGVSRAIVDAGWAEQAIQVGKSGKTVSPALYFACGVSGAVHHTMGMDTAKVVVAINTDPKAPIFQYADYGILGDALEVLPAVTEEIRKALG